MPIGSIIGGLFGAAGSLFGASSQASAAEKAAQLQNQAANRAIDLQQQEWQQVTQNLQPFLAAGTNALGGLQNLYNGTSQTPYGINFGQPISSVIGPPPSPTNPALSAEFQASPGYNYQLQQAMQQIQNSAAGRTGAISGNMLQALQTNATGLANQDYWNWYNNLVNSWGNNYQNIANQRSGVTGVLQNLLSGGQAAAAQQGQFGQQAVTNIGNQLALGASALGAGQIGAANAYGNAFNSLANNPSLSGALTSGINYLVGSGASGGSGIYGGGGAVSGGTYYDPSVATGGYYGGGGSFQ